LLPSGFSTQPLLVAQAGVDRPCLQLVHHSRARLHRPVPAPQQLPQIAILLTRNPNLWKVIFQLQGLARRLQVTARMLFGLKSADEWMSRTKAGMNLQPILNSVQSK
jgi:hypothetical protein